MGLDISLSPAYSSSPLSTRPTLDRGGDIPARRQDTRNNVASAPAGELDSVELSEQAKDALKAIQTLTNGVSGGVGGLLSGGNNELSEEEKKIVEDLKETDQKVRAHEQAHKTVGGQYAGSISYETVTGPDGREYAVGGEVDIDVSPVPNNPEATVRKMDIVIRAALAPAEPSPQDFAVARTAQQIRTQAQKEASDLLQAEQQAENNNKSELLNPDDFDPNAADIRAGNVQKKQSDSRYLQAAINLIVAQNSTIS